jgi:hypothetical protein
MSDPPPLRRTPPLEKPTDLHYARDGSRRDMGSNKAGVPPQANARQVHPTIHPITNNDLLTPGMDRSAGSDPTD